MTEPATVTRAAADIGGTFTDVVLTPDGRRPASSPLRELRGRGHRGGAEPPRGARVAARRARGAVARLHRRDQRDPRGQGRADRAPHHPRVPRRARAPAGAGAGALRTPLRAPAAARAAPAPLRGRRADGAARRGAPPPRRSRGAGGGGAHPGRRDRGGRGLLPPLLRESRPRTADRRDPPGDAPRRLRLPLGGRAAPEARVRAHLHHRHQRLRRVLRSSGTSARWSPRSRRPASAAGSW